MKDYLIELEWANGFKEKYVQGLTLKQLDKEEERLNNIRNVTKVTISESKSRTGSNSGRGKGTAGSKRKAN